MTDKQALQSLYQLQAFFNERYKNNVRMSRDIAIALNDLVEAIEPRID
jgi:hypothetical protein